MTVDRRRLPRPYPCLRAAACLWLALGPSAGAFGAGFCAAAHGQDYNRAPLRSVTGTVTDPSHEPLRGAVVELEMEGAMTVQSYITDERGAYHFRNLRPDADYTVWATFRGQHSKKEGISRFDHKGDRVIPLVIRPE